MIECEEWKAHNVQVVDDGGDLARPQPPVLTLPRRFEQKACWAGVSTGSQMQTLTCKCQTERSPCDAGEAHDDAPRIIFVLSSDFEVVVRLLPHALQTPHPCTEHQHHWTVLVIIVASTCEDHHVLVMSFLRPHHRLPSAQVGAVSGVYRAIEAQELGESPGAEEAKT
eukprot:2086084-Rhodomonas_salina.1